MLDLLPWWGWLAAGMILGAPIGFVICAIITVASATRAEKSIDDFLADRDDWGAN